MNALDILLSMLFNLLLASVTILLCFYFLFLLFLKTFLQIVIIENVIENVKLQLAPIIPVGAPITVANDAIEILPDNIDKTFNDLPK